MPKVVVVGGAAAQIREQMSGPENQFWAVGCGLGWTVK